MRREEAAAASRGGRISRVSLAEQESPEQAVPVAQEEDGWVLLEGLL